MKKLVIVQVDRDPDSNEIHAVSRIMDLELGTEAGFEAYIVSDEDIKTSNPVVRNLLDETSSYILEMLEDA